MKIVSICLSRKNSKRFPNKVMADLNGKPMIFYTLEIMKKLGYESYLYTDNEELRNYAKKEFPEINVRIKPDVYAQDKHLTNIELTKYNKDIQADVFIYLAGTSPLRQIEIVQKGIKTFIDNMDRYDCAMAVKELPDRMYWFGYAPCSFELKHRTFNNSETIRKKIFEETGSLYIFKKELLQNNFFINNKCLFVNDEINIDVDNIVDLKQTEKHETSQVKMVNILKEIEDWYFNKYKVKMPVLNYKIMNEYKKDKKES